MSIGKSIKRIDAYAKVTGQARYTDDFFERRALVAKIVHSTIANGLVTAIDIEEALKVEGVVKIVTCFDVPDIAFPTAGHPWSTDKAHQDVANMKLLNTRVRFYGDNVAAIIAEDEVAAAKALSLVKVTYDEYTPLLTMEAAMAEDAPLLHEDRPHNILAHSQYELGDFEKAIQEEGLLKFEGSYETPIVQHCHIENPISYAYMESGRIVIVSSTQIPHIVRRVVGQALGIPWGKVRVIKPYIGGGFGNKQEVLYEPLNAYLTTVVGGRCVKLDITREETFVSTRTRHAINFKLTTYVHKDGTFAARSVIAHSNQGAYASHGHSIVSNSVSAFRHLYSAHGAVKGEAYTVFTNLPAGGAMRGYGIPQIIFALESHVDEIAKSMHIDPITLREKNMMQEGYVDPYTKITCHTSGLLECIEQGKAFIHWDEKQAAYANQTGPIRRGVGMAIFSYKTGVYPISLETASARLVLNQDGSVGVQMGATEIGQGADTVFAQMTSETLGISMENIHINSTQDTDVTPFDTAAYASRQSYVSGMALKKTALIMKEKLLAYASYMLKCPIETLDIASDTIISKEDQEPLLPLSELALEAFYSLENSQHITAEATNQCKSNTFSLGATFVEIEVDIPLGKINVLNIINLHDSGKILNPQLAAGQVHGGMSMGLGYGLSEQLLFDAKSGKPLNNNLLDYKLMTTMDTPDLHTHFVETEDPTGPFGNKSLGEPPAISPAPAIRNALLGATGIAFNSIPLNPEKLFKTFKENGLISKGV